MLYKIELVASDKPVMSVSYHIHSSHGTRAAYLLPRPPLPGFQATNLWPSINTSNWGAESSRICQKACKGLRCQYSGMEDTKHTWIP